MKYIHLIAGMVLGSEFQGVFAMSSATDRAYFYYFLLIAAATVVIPTIIATFNSFGH